MFHVYGTLQYNQKYCHGNTVAMVMLAAIIIYKVWSIIYVHKYIIRCYCIEGGAVALLIHLVRILYSGSYLTISHMLS